MKRIFTHKMIISSSIALVAILIILAFLIVPKFKQTNTLTAGTLAIPEYGSAMVTSGDSTKQITGEISIDAFGHITIKDDQTGMVFEILASQIIDSDKLVSFSTSSEDGQTVEVIGEIVAQSDNGTSTVLDPTTGTQYVVETQSLKKISTTVRTTQSTTESTTSVPSNETIAPTTTSSTQSVKTTQSTEKKTVSTTASTTVSTSQPTVAPTTLATTQAPVIADDITHESYTVSTDPTLETAYIGPSETEIQEPTANEAISMNTGYIQDILEEINRVRHANGTSTLTLDPSGSDYSQTVLAFATELALGIANNSPSFPHLWTVTTSTNGTSAAQRVLEMSSAVLDSSIHTVAIWAVQSGATGDIYLVIAF